MKGLIKKVRENKKGFTWIGRLSFAIDFVRNTKRP